MRGLSSPIGDRTVIPCIAGCILNGWTTREVPIISSYCQLVFHCTDVPCVVYPFIIWWSLSCFHFSAMMNNAAVLILVWMYVFNSLRYILRSGIAGSDGNFMFNPSRVRQFSTAVFQTVFHGSFAILHSHQQCEKVLTPPQPHWGLKLSVFLITDILVENLNFLELQYSLHMKRFVF